MNNLVLTLNADAIPPNYSITYVDGINSYPPKNGEIKYIKSKSKFDNEKKLFEEAIPILNSWYDSLVDKHLVDIIISFSTPNFGKLYGYRSFINVNGYTYYFLFNRKQESNKKEKEKEENLKNNTIILLEL